MSRLRLIAALLVSVLVAMPSSALAQTGEVQILEVNTTRYDEGGQVTMVVGFRDLTENIDPAGLVVTVDGQPVENLDIAPLASSQVPVGVVLAIDTSGSMEGGPMEAAKDAAGSFVEQKRPEDFVAIVTFAQEVQILQGFTNNEQILLDRIDALEPAGGTAFNDGVLAAIALFDNPSAESLRPNVIVLTDGDDTTSSVANPAEVAGLVAESGVRVFGIALETEEFTPDAVASVADAGDGLFLSTPDPAALEGLYGQIQREINNVLVARFTVPNPEPGERAFAIDYAGLTALSSTEVPGYVTTTTGAVVTTTVVFPEAQVRVVESPLPAPRETLALIAAIGTGAALALFVWILFGRREEEGGGAFAKRLQAYGRQRTGPEEKASFLERIPLLRRFSQAAEDQVRRRGLLSGVNSALEQANIPLSPGEFIMASIGLAIVAGLFGAIFNGVIVGAIVFVGVVLFVYGFIRWAGSREKRRFEKQLPDTLTLLSTSLRAGYSLLQAVEAVAAEAPDPTAREFGRAIAEARLGRSVTEALDGITHRTQSKDFEWAVMAIEIQREVGGNLAEVLQTVADTMLQRNRLRGEIKALTAEGRISAFVLGSLPFVMAGFLWTSNRAYLQPLFDETVGRIAIAGGVVLMAAGIFWLRKIIDIDV